MQTGKSTRVWESHQESLRGHYQKTASCSEACVWVGVCLMSACTDIIMCVSAQSHMHAYLRAYACESVCMRASSMVRGHVRSRRRVLLRWSVNLNEQIAPVCMYSPVNRVDSVTQRPCGYALYLPSKNGCVIGAFNCSLYFDFLFSLNWKLEGLLYL